MFTNKDSIKVKITGMTDYLSLGQYLVEAKYGYNKLWGEDSGRNLNGDMVATLIGIFPKLELQFRKLTKAELELLTPILDAPRQSVKYYDPYKKAEYEMETYTGDYSITNKKIIDATTKNEGFNISFISTKKRS